MKKGSLLQIADVEGDVLEAKVPVVVESLL